MATSDGLSGEDWDLVHELALEIANAEDGVISQKLSPRVSQNLSTPLEARRPFSAYGISSMLSKSFLG
jgi:hypothetical protein